MYSNDLEPGSPYTAPGVTATWSSYATTTAPSGERFRGEFGKQAVTLTLSGLPANAAVSVAFDLYVIRSWDGNAGNYGPDYWALRSTAGGTTETVVRETFTNRGKYQSFGGRDRVGAFPARTGAGEVNELGYTFRYSNSPTPVPDDTTYAMAYEVVAGADGKVVLTFAGQTTQPTSDESWGLDNVVVRTAGTFVSVTSSADEAVEGGGPVTYTFSRTGDTSAALDVGYTLGGTATAGTDFTGPTGTVHFGANVSKVSVTLTPTADNLVEGNETAVVTINSTSAYEAAPSYGSAVVTIVDNPVVVTIDSAPVAITEGETKAIVFRRSGGDLSLPLDVSYRLAGTAGMPDGGTVRFAANSATATIEVTAADDLVDEPDEEFTLTVLTTAQHQAGDPAVATVRIVDDDGPTLLSILYFDPQPP